MAKFFEVALTKVQTSATKVRVILPSLMLLGLFLVLQNTGCAMQSSRPELQNQSAGDRPLVENKYSLKADREQLEELRKDIPQDVKKRNDEISLMQEWMGEIKRKPSEIREKFSSMLAKKREVFQRDMTKRREGFQKQQTKEREVFNKELEVARKDFASGKHSSEERSEFYSNLETKRRDFYTAQREKRDEFEAQVSEDRKNFEDYARERTNEFNQQHKEYTKRYEDFQKEKQKNQAPVVNEIK